MALGLLGVLLFAAAPATAAVLAVKAARAGHRSGRIAEMVSGPLLVATLFLTLLLGWIGLIVTAVVAVLVFVWARPRQHGLARTQSLRPARRPRCRIKWAALCDSGPLVVPGDADRLEAVDELRGRG